MGGSLHPLHSLHAELTAYIVETAEPPATGQRFIRDSLTPGLALRITAGGSKAYVVEAWVNNRSRRVTLGKHPGLSLKDARKCARQEIGKFAMGRDVAAERKAERSTAVTLGEVFEDYIAKRDLKPGTMVDYRRVMAEAFDDWRSRPVTSITKDMVEARNAQLGARSKARAANAMRVLRALLYYAAAKYRDAEDRPIVQENPVKRLSETRTWHRVGRRSSVIKRHQLPGWLAAVMSMGDGPRPELAGAARDYLLFLLFTGLRKSEAARLTWGAVDIEGRQFVIEDTKNRDRHTLPLSDFLNELLSHRPRESEYVFSGPAGGPLLDPRYWIDKVTERSGVEFTLHDLRRTFATIAESLDIPAYALKRLLNHRTNAADVTAGYIVHDVERLRRPMQAITEYLLSAGGIRPAAEVIELRR
ncbi:MAG: tyrosine-type recombinase/integrase [Gammaproteobacteria bacterium]